MKDEILKILEDKNLSVLEQNKQIDSFFGIDYVVETKFKHQSPEAYKDQLTIDGLNTAYIDIYKLVTFLKKDSVILDVGAGYCRFALLMSIFRPDILIVSIDFVNERMKKAIQFTSHHHIKNVLFFNEDISSFKLEIDIDYLFFYFPVCDQLKFFIENNLKNDHSIIAIESHGDFFDFVDNELIGFEVVNSFPLSITRHDCDMRIYQYINHSKFLEFERIFCQQRDELMNKQKLKFTNHNLQLSTYIFIKMRKIDNVKVSFKNGEVYDIKSLQNSYFEQYQIESKDPRRVYKYSEILHFFYNINYIS